SWDASGHLPDQSYHLTSLESRLLQMHHARGGSPTTHADHLQTSDLHLRASTVRGLTRRQDHRELISLADPGLGTQVEVRHILDRMNGLRHRERHDRTLQTTRRPGNHTPGDGE